MLFVVWIHQQVHYCSITKAQLGVSLKLNTLQDYFHHSGSIQKACKSSHDGPTTITSNSWLKQIVGKPHPNIFAIVDVIKKKQATTEINLEKFAAGTNQPPMKEEIHLTRLIVVIPLLESEMVIDPGLVIHSNRQSHWCCPTLERHLVELLAMLLEQSLGEQSRWLLSSTQSVWGSHPQICTTLATPKPAWTFGQIAWE